MPAPAQLVAWLKQKYPSPQIDQEWLGDCYAYIVNDLDVHPSNTELIREHVETQFLASDLRDSAIPNTGLPIDLKTTADGRVRDVVLVQIMAISEIGQSAFSLQNVRQTRIERADLAGLGADNDNDGEQQDNANEDDDGEDAPIPRYPRGMLRFELTDGSQQLSAIEYRRMNNFELGVTPLGCKLSLRNTVVRKGMLFLESATCVVHAGSAVEELEAEQDNDFLNGLKSRLGQTEPAAEQNGPGDERNNRQAPRPAEPAPVIPPAARLPGPPPRPPPTTGIRPPAAPAPSFLNSGATPSSSQLPSSSTVVASGGRNTAVSQSQLPPSKSPYFSTNKPISTWVSNLQLPNLSSRSAVHLPPPHLPPRATVPEEESYDIDDDIDDDFLKELESVENRALSKDDGRVQNVTKHAPTTKVANQTKVHKPPPMPQPSQYKQRSTQSHRDVIEVGSSTDSDVDMNPDSQKENRTLSQSKKRRRLEPQRRSAVIDISD